MAIILTNQGAAKITAAQTQGTGVILSSIAFGDGNGAAITPNADMTSLVQEVYRSDIFSIKQHASDTSVFVLEGNIPALAGGFWIREIGLYDKDNTLIAVGEYPEFFKDTDSVGIDMKINFMAKVTSATANTFLLDPAVVLASRQYVDNKNADLEGKMAAEQSARESADTDINNKINAINTGVDELETTLTEAIDDEKAQREAADVVLDSKIDDDLQALETKLAADIQEAKDIATGASISVVFDTKAQLDAWLAGTYTRPDGLFPADLKPGENIYITDGSSPDYWWDGSTIKELTLKTDLSGYYTKEQTDAALVLKEALIKNATAKTTLVDADTLPLSDSAASNATKKITWANFKAVLKTYFSTLFVAKETGKGLSSNDYTTEDKTKLAGIEAGAQVNTVTSVAGKTGVITLAKADVGLGNVDNTRDSDKPISTATQAALDLKTNISPNDNKTYALFNGDMVDTQSDISVPKQESASTTVTPFDDSKITFVIPEENIPDELKVLCNKITNSGIADNIAADGYTITITADNVVVFTSNAYRVDSSTVTSYPPTGTYNSIALLFSNVNHLQDIRCEIAGLDTLGIAAGASVFVTITHQLPNAQLTFAQKDNYILSPIGYSETVLAVNSEYNFIRLPVQSKYVMKIHNTYPTPNSGLQVKELDLFGYLFELRSQTNGANVSFALNVYNNIPVGANDNYGFIVNSYYISGLLPAGQAYTHFSSSNQKITLIEKTGESSANTIYNTIKLVVTNDVVVNATTTHTYVTIFEIVILLVPSAGSIAGNDLIATIHPTRVITNE
jgi:hypothetical protein